MFKLIHFALVICVFTKLTKIEINNTLIWPVSQTIKKTSWQRDLPIRIFDNDQIKVTADSPFVFFLSSKLFQQYTSDLWNNMALQGMAISHQNNNIYVAKMRINIKCSYTIHPYLKYNTNVHVDFTNGTSQQQVVTFKSISICASTEQIHVFSKLFIPGYVIFWIIFNLSLQIYHNYMPDRSHLFIFIFYLGYSLALQYSLWSSIISLSLFTIVLFIQKIQRKLTLKHFSFYLLFISLFIIQVANNFQQNNQNSQWRGVWVILDNFITIHTSMFIVMRAFRLRRIRQVFWYFLICCLFSYIFQSTDNTYFQLRFMNPLDLTPLSWNCFFVIMMLPISNYFTSITSWMHRFINIILIVISVCPLNWAIKIFGMTCILIIIFQIKRKGISVIRHTN